MKLFSASLALAAGTLTAFAQDPPNICFVVYQMADNDLDEFLRNDNLEIIQSCAVSKPNFFTWVYFDGFGSANDPYEWGWYPYGQNTDPLESVFEKDGVTPLSGDACDGSQYLTYRHDLNKMVSDTKLPGEYDGDDPQTLKNFLTHAFEDCVAKGATEFMLSLSSHGGGFGGFGGDDNPSRRRGRLLGSKADETRGRDLAQENYSIKEAIQQALEEVDGAPDMLDVLGFDACLMMSVSTLYEFDGVAKYYLASEATEPGHGWAYKQLCRTDSALALAEDIHEKFLSETQGYPDHQPPKTLALVDTSKFAGFKSSLEAFARDLKSAIEADNDIDFFALLQRSRADSVSFASVLDDPGTNEKSALDVGTFLHSFDDLCSPKTGTALRSSLDAVKTMYGDMFVRQGNGPGTPPSTGMHVTWPLKKDYNAYPAFFNINLFQNNLVTRTAPEFFDMVLTFLQASSPPSMSNTGGICAKSAQSEVEPAREGQLLLNPAISSTDGIVTVRSDLATSTDDVFVEYGIDGTAWLFLPERRRQRRELKKLSKVDPSDSTFAPCQTASLPAAEDFPSLSALRMLSSARRRAHQATRQDVEEGYLFVYGGSVEGSFSGSAFVATGARGFYFLKDSDNQTPIFLYTYPLDTADQKFAEIPVMYFPAGIDIKSEDLSYETTLEMGIAMGGRFGALTFGLNEADGGFTTTSFALMTNDANTTSSTISETPPSAGGRIVPIVYVDGMADGQSYSDILGGVDQTVIEWSDAQNFSLMFMSPEKALLYFGLGSSTVVIDMYAFDYDEIDDFDNLEVGKGFDFHRFEVEIDADLSSVAVWRKPGAWLVSLMAFIGAYFA